MTEESVFAGALSLCPEERSAFLEHACAGRPRLRAAVEGLLAAHEKPHNLLDRRPAGLGQTVDSCPDAAVDDPAATIGHTSPTDAPTDAGGWAAGEVIAGRYALQEKIGEGGMGAVLRGRDCELGRDLAVKVLLPKHAGRPDVARRFAEEARVGARLQHPGVVPVYDLGSAGGRPFFTMKLVKGETLTSLLHDRAAPASDRPRFLAIALAVSQALAYAHAHGVIHRDLKPSNVMVGAFGEVQVMDWGLAKVLAESGADGEEAAPGRQPEDARVLRTAPGGTAGSHGTETEAGSLLGTPAYMPPEQANGDVTLLDRRADVFGSGAILCEILTGKPPYVGRSNEEVRRKAANGDLADAMARLDACGAEAELIALAKACLAPEAIDRPKDAQAVADGLSAYLNGVQERLHRAELARAAEVARAQEAQATAAQERKAREAAQARAVAERRARRLTLALAGTVLLAVTLGGGGWLWVKNERDARQARVTRDVNDALNMATAFRVQARTANRGSGLLFGQAREQTQRALALVGNSPVDAALVEQVARLQNELDEEEKDRRLITALDEAWLAQTETLVGENRFAFEQAVPKFREAFRAYGLPPGEGGPKTAARIRQRPTAIREALVAALDDWDALAGHPRLKITEPHREWLRAVLEAAEPEDTWGRKVRAARGERDEVRRQAALEALAKSADVAKLPPRTLTGLSRQLPPHQALDLLRRAQRHYPADFWINSDLGGVLLVVTPPERDEAVRFQTVAVALRPDSPGCHLNLGDAQNARGRVDEAIACYEKAIELDPKDARAHNNLGAILCDVKRDYDGAIVCFRKAIALDPKYALAHNNLGNALSGKGQVDEAIACFRKAIEIDPKYANAHNNLGNALSGKGQVDEAIACYRKVIEIDPKHAMAHTNLGNELSRKGQVDEGITCFRKAIEIDPKLANAHGALGQALLGKGRFAEAREATARALELLPEQHPLRAVVSRQMQTCERLAKLERRLPGLLKGEDKAVSVRESLDFAEMCRLKRLTATATRFWADAFAADAKLADDLRAGRRYNAACDAALAAAGQGEDAGKLDGSQRRAMRRQALTWLRADLASRARLFATGDVGRIGLAKIHTHWRKDADLSALRDEAALLKLPAEERAACEKLWADVAALLKKAGGEAK